MAKTTNAPARETAPNLPDLVEKDIGARRIAGLTAGVILPVAVVWSLFQLWIASPFQYYFNFLVFNSTEARSIHLAFAIFLTFMVCPAFRRSPRDYIPIQDWLMGLIGGICAGYIYFQYEALTYRPGAPTELDLWVSVAGVLLLLEAARRSLGMPLVIIAALFLAYTFAGPWMPDLIAHRGHSLPKVASHQWLSTEGVFGVALGVSTSFVFLFVLFGALLERAGAGNYFIQVAFALLGHMRGGPAKAAVLSSAMTGLVSGSSIANVVMTGTFTIPLMRRIGFSREKAGAVEVSGSVNGQIMPPVMGAAAFLMVEYIGIPYSEVVRGAFIPAIISYLALLYIVHLEAMKQDMPTLPRRHSRTLFYNLIAYGITISSILILAGILYYAIGWVKALIPGFSMHIFIGFAVAAYLGLLYYASRHEPLIKDDPTAPVFELPDFASTVRTGLHYLLPLVILIWCLIIERLSPGLSAFWACMSLIAMVLTQRPLLALFRRWGSFLREARAAVGDLIEGLQMGARNMVGIGVATAAAGIIVGTVSLTGIGLVMTQIVEMLAGDSFFLVLVFTALICIVLGMGLPTTANYVVVASIMVPVISELGAQHGFFIPLLAIHLFVFYFGIMADITPPVGLASFAAAAVSGGDPIKTGVQSFIYSCRTVVLPFFFVFNHKLLLIGVSGVFDGLLVFLLYTAAIMIFSAATMGWFLVRSRLWESVVLLLAASMLFIPGRWLELAYPKYADLPPTALEEVIAATPDSELLHMKVEVTNKLGDLKQTYLHIPLAGETTAERMKNLGLKLGNGKDSAMVVDLPMMGKLEKAGLSRGDMVLEVRMPQPQPPRETMYAIGFALTALIAGLQGMRRRRARRKVATPEVTALAA